MMRTSPSYLDPEHVLVLIEEVNSATTTQALRQRTVYGLGALFESVSCAWTELKTDLFEKQLGTTTVAQSNDNQLVLNDWISIFNQHAWQHPAISHIIDAGSSTALSISDVCSREYFTSLELYRHFYARVSVEDQLSIGYVEDGYLKGVSINRATWGFTDIERKVLTKISHCILPHYRLLQRFELDAAKQLPLLEVTVNAIVMHGDVLGLTPREAEILGEVACGKSNKQIASTCAISEGTVRKHLENAFRQLDVNNRISAITKAAQMIRQNIGEDGQACADT